MKKEIEQADKICYNVFYGNLPEQAENTGMGGNLPSGTRKIQKRTEKNMTDHYSDMELIEKVKEKIASADKVLIGLGEEWKRGINDDRELLSAYDSLYELIKDKDYFIVTMAVDGMIFDTALGSRMDRTVSSDPEPEETFSVLLQIVRRWP